MSEYYIDYVRSCQKLSQANVTYPPVQSPIPSNCKNLIMIYCHIELVLSTNGQTGLCHYTSKLYISVLTIRHACIYIYILYIYIHIYTYIHIYIYRMGQKIFYDNIFYFLVQGAWAQNGILSTGLHIIRPHSTNTPQIGHNKNWKFF